MKKIVKTALLLSGLSVPQKVEKARAIVIAMTGNPNFTNPFPALAEVTTAADGLEKSFLDSRGGDHTAAKLMRENDRVLNRLLLAVSQYVEYIANLSADNADSIIAGAGLSVKNPLPLRATGFTVDNTDLPGKVHLRTRFLPRASYKWEFAMADDPVPQWIESAITVQASVFIDGLKSAKVYLFRVSTVTKDGQGPLSNELKLLVA